MHRLHLLRASAVLFGLAVSAAASAATITGTGIGRFPSAELGACDFLPVAVDGTPINCDIRSTGANPADLLVWGSTGTRNVLENPSTLTAVGVNIAGETDALGVTIGRLDWFNSPTLAERGPASIDFRWRLVLDFTSPSAETVGRNFDLTITNVEDGFSGNNPPDRIGRFRLASLNALANSVVLDDVLMTNVRYELASGLDGSRTSFNPAANNPEQFIWRNSESYTSVLLVKADFVRVPEPAAGVLLAVALAGLGVARRRRDA